MKGRRTVQGKREYLIKWKGFSEDDCTWEPLSNLEACAKMIAKYDKEHDLGEDKERAPASKAARQDKKNLREKDASIDGQLQANDHKEQKSMSPAMAEKEAVEPHYQVLKRTSMDSEIIFKVFDPASKKDQFISRKDLLKEDPVALCLFYEKHIVS